MLDAGGDYLLLVKANQPRLFQAIEWLFDPPFTTLPVARVVPPGDVLAGSLRVLTEHDEELYSTGDSWEAERTE